jgi:uncharacterized protein
VSPMRHLRAVVWFLVLTFGLTWLLWSPLWLGLVGLQSIQGVCLGAFGMWMPGLSAILVLRLFLRESIRTTTIDRLGRKRYYLWAWLLPLAGTLVSTGLTVLFGAARFDFEFHHLREAIEAAGGIQVIPLWTIVVAQLLAAITIAPLLNAVFALGEEVGWRGFLLPRLMAAGLGQWWAIVLSGMIWGLWHAPIIALGHNYPDHPYLGVLLTIVFGILLGVVFAWLQLASGSVWVPTIAHGAMNAIAGLPFLLLTPFDTALGGMLTSVIGWIPLGLFIAWLVYSKRLPVRP